jgi:hypothetical protein
MQAMNKGLDEVHTQIGLNADKTLSFLDDIIDKDKAKLDNTMMPLVTGLKGLYFNMDAKLNIATQLLNYNNN